MTKETILRKLEHIEALLRGAKNREAQKKLAYLIGEIEVEALNEQNGLSDFDRQWLVKNAPEIADHDPASRATRQATKNIKTMFGL